MAISFSELEDLHMGLAPCWLAFLWGWLIVWLLNVTLIAPCIAPRTPDLRDGTRIHCRFKVGISTGQSLAPGKGPHGDFR